MSKPSLVIPELAGLVSYNPETGEFHWADHPRMRGKKAGNICGSGYAVIRFKQTRVLAHRLAMFKVYGHVPAQIDHINGDKADNRIANLRAVTEGINAQNRAPVANRNNSSGFLGVYDCPGERRLKRWAARIRVPGEKSQRHLGHYNTPEEAHEAYLKAKAEFHLGWERKALET